MKAYFEHLKRRKLLLAVSFLLLVISLVVSIKIGSVPLSFSQIFNSLIGKQQGLPFKIIWNIRLVRILTAVVVGAGLAAAGAVMQCVLENPLASPFTLGISQGAAFGAAFSIVILKAGQMTSSTSGSVIISNPYQTSFFAFLGALLAVTVVLSFGKVKKLSAQGLILTGISMSFIFTAGLTLLQYLASDIELAAIIFWTFGDLGRTNWSQLALISIITSAVILYFFVNSWNYNALLSGEETAQSLGVNPQRVRMLGVLLSSLLSAVCVSFVGVIGFVGLLSPHMVRRVIGSDYRFLLPASALWGATLLVLSDTFSRILLSPVILPVGIITSLMGTFLFLYLIGRGGFK